MKNIFKKLNAKNATILGIVIIVGLAVSIGAVYGLSLIHIWINRKTEPKSFGFRLFL